MGKKKHTTQSGQEIATAISKDENSLKQDTGGRRSGIDRRKNSHDINHPERRSGQDRRTTPDRRSSPHFTLYEDIERRKGFQALYQELHGKYKKPAQQPEQIKDIATRVLSGSSLNSQAVKYGISNHRVRTLVHQYCRDHNKAAYENALVETRRLSGKNKNLPSIHSLRRYAEQFV